MTEFITIKQENTPYIWFISLNKIEDVFVGNNNFVTFTTSSNSESFFIAEPYLKDLIDFLVKHSMISISGKKS